MTLSTTNFNKKSAAVRFIAALAFCLCLSAFFGYEASAFSYEGPDYDYDYDYDYNPGNEYDEDGNLIPPSPTPTVTPEPTVSNLQFALTKTTYAYTGAAITPAVSVKGTDSNGQTVTLKENVDYTVQYENNVQYGVGRVIILGMGNYDGYHILKFGILPEKVSKVKVKSPFYMENTVTWNKAKGAEGYYIYRKEAGKKEYSYIANVTDSNFQVFHDKSKNLKKNKKYSYKVVSYVADPNYNEDTDGDTYRKPDDKKQEAYSWYDESYRSGTSYYSSYDNTYYRWYNYSAVKEKCKLAFEASGCGTASGKATSKVSGRYPIYTGDANIDYMAYLTNKKIIKKGMSDDKRVQAIFNWMVKNCTFTKDVKDYSKLKKMKCYINYNKSSFKKKAEAYENKILKQIYQGKALCIGPNWHDCDRAEVAFAYHKGSCSYLTPMFNILCNQAGIEAYIVDGYYVNKDKSKDYHNWSFVKLGKKYYWYDVPVACKNKNVKSVWYKKGTKFWKTCHSWKKNATKGYEGAAFKK